MARLFHRFDRRVSHRASPATIVVSAAVALVVVLGLTYVALVAPRGVPGLRYYELDAQFDDASQIADLSEVRLAGRHVGQVTHSELSDGHATVRLQLFPGEGPLPADTKARVRLKGLLGAKFVDLTPGHSRRMLPSGGTLPATQTSTSVELLDVFQALDAPSRAHLQTAVKGLGNGVLGRGDELNEMLQRSPGFLGDVEHVSTAILGRSGAAARFGPSVEQLSGAYDPVRKELAAGFRPEARVLEAFAARGGAIDHTLGVAPPALRTLRTALDASTPLLDETAGLARETRRLTADAPLALRRTSVLLDRAAPALEATRPLLTRVADATAPTLAFLHRADPVLRPATQALADNVQALLGLGRHSCDVLSFAKNWRSTLGFGVRTDFGDPIGDLDAGQPGLGPLNSLRVVAVRPLELEALNADAPATKGDPRIGRNAYPDPCAADGERK